MVRRAESVNVSVNRLLKLDQGSIKKLKRVSYIPSSIFNEKLSSLGSIVKYLKENKDLNYKQIACLLNRNYDNIAQTYRKLKKTKLKITPSIKIPLSIFRTDKSILESLVSYLKNKSLTYKEISLDLKRDERTIWTINKRAQKRKKVRDNFKKNLLQSLRLDKIKVPLSVFENGLSALETIVKYLVEELSLSYIEISVLLNRSYDNIAQTYRKVRLHKKLLTKKGISVPIRVFRKTKYSTLENLALFLKKSYSYRETARILNRNERTIWTVIKRANDK